MEDKFISQIYILEVVLNKTLKMVNKISMDLKGYFLEGYLFPGPLETSKLNF
jgi:hypothetical protein